MNRPRLRPDTRLVFDTPVLRHDAVTFPFDLKTDMERLRHDMENLGRDSLRYRNRSARRHREHVRAVWRHIAMAWHLAADDGRIDRARLLIAEDAMSCLHAIQNHEAQLGVVVRVQAKKEKAAEDARVGRSAKTNARRAKVLAAADDLRKLNPRLSDSDIARKLADEHDWKIGTVRGYLGGR